MPIREYQSKDQKKRCQVCRDRFERIERLNDLPLLNCPQCGAEVIRLISAPRVGASSSGADDRAKRAGFHKLKKISKGEYEKLY
jgi:putative FmdB family regulatory protein